MTDASDDFAVVETQLRAGGNMGYVTNPTVALHALARIQARLAQAEAERDETYYVKREANEQLRGENDELMARFERARELATRCAEDRAALALALGRRLASLEAAGRDVLREGYGNTPGAVAAWDGLRAALAESEATPNTDPRGTWVHRNHGSSWEVPSVHENVTVVPAPTDEHGGRCPTCGSFDRAMAGHPFIIEWTPERCRDDWHYEPLGEPPA